MNAEVSRYRKVRNFKEIIDNEPQRIEFNLMTACIHKLNDNISKMYNLEYGYDIDINYFVEKFVDNIYLIIKMFSEMGVYPDYFFDAVIKMNVEYRKKANNNSLRGNYQLFNEIGLAAEVSRTIREGMEKGLYKVNESSQRDFNSYYFKIISFFRRFAIPYNINTKEQCKKTFDDICFNHQSIIARLENSDDIYDDIEYLLRLLFEYSSFFVSLGINPSKYLNSRIDDATDDIESVLRTGNSK